MNIFSFTRTFIALLIGVSCAAAEVPVTRQADGGIANWTVRATAPADVSCVQNGKQTAIRFNAPKQTVMVSANTAMPLTDFITVKVRAGFKGKGSIQVGFHLYGKKGYCCTFPGKNYILDSPDEIVRLESVQVLGRYSDGYTDPDLLPAFGNICVYASPGTTGEVSDFSYEIIKNQPDTTSPIAPRSFREFHCSSTGWSYRTPSTRWKALKPMCISIMCSCP